jgi:L-Ala-D/L-Glu epimerase
MQVDGVELRERRVHVEHANAKTRWDERRGIVIELRTPLARGRGEASPLPGYSVDDLPACAAQLDVARSKLARFELDDDVRVAMRAAVEHAAVTAPAAVFAIETAVLDLVARARGVPAWTLLRGDDAAQPIPLSALAEGATPDDLGRSAEAARARGIGVVKVKVGGAECPERDVLRLEAVRSRAGTDLALRLDANQAIPIERLAAAFAAFRTFAPELLEEPALPEHLASVGDPGVPLALDESLARGDWRERIRDAGARGRWKAVVLKPTALGGILRCLAMADAAHEAGLATIVTHTFDGPIATASAACFALALRGRVLPCGLDSHGRLANALPAITATHVAPFTEPGLGVEDDAS